MTRDCLDLYREIEALSGQSCGLHPNGGLMLAATQGELDSLKLICSRARYLGMETEMISLEQALQFNPLIDTRHFIGALWRADGGHCDPSGTTHAYVKAARKLGVSPAQASKLVARLEERLERDEYESRIEQLKKEVEAEIRRRLVADRGVEHVEAGGELTEAVPLVVGLEHPVFLLADAVAVEAVRAPDLEPPILAPFVVDLAHGAAEVERLDQ